ncbi:ribonuclease R [Ruminococcus sp. HUN007]|uniref:ribonuclease R n=1 Tax=Ruminococcus sp. HUN007 TaxID=1514668 RepID=UPI000678FC5A|nr:ribonuclease R [Ruminococcus sp. HUN007]
MANTKHSTSYYKNKILLVLNQAGKKPLTRNDMIAKSKCKKTESDVFKKALDELKSEGLICDQKKGYVLCSRMGYFKATVKRISKTFGFIEKDEDQTEVFIPGKFLMGAMPGDKVIANLIPSRTGKPEGEVISIVETADATITGVLDQEYRELFIIPDTMSKTAVRVVENECGAKPGDKVIARIIARGTSHSAHKAAIVSTFGSSEKASSCAMALLKVSGISLEFPADAQAEAKKLSEDGIRPEDLKKRLDLRDEIIFTIDSAESKDLDDAISITRTDSGYQLGVHIADVSHYVKGNSPLDKEALVRGTSVYYADRVVPMLPKELSNGICSLNPDEDRLAFSCLIDLDKQAKIKGYKFHKTVIRSAVKGVYKEINTILDGTATDETKQKYARVNDNIFIMNELADILMENRDKRGAPSLETSESKLIINENDICVDVVPRTRGKSEMIIEEFMLLANQCAANLARTSKIPFVYRIHEDPSLEKLADMKDFLTRMNIEFPHFSEVKPAHFAEILKNNRDSEKFPVINNILLRSMAKAKYAPDPVGHFGLALEDYSHFTSPIRRYPDLAIHRILTDLVSGCDAEWLTKRYQSFVTNASERSTSTEITAVKIERDCEACYMAEYMKAHLGEEFEGIISSVTDFGFYVELDNTVEGLVHINTLEDDTYEYDGLVSLKGERSGKIFALGDKVKVQCTASNVNSGNIDFSIVKEA